MRAPILEQPSPPPLWLRVWTVALALLFALPASPGLSAPGIETAAPPPDILIINSYAPGYAWSDDMQQGLLRVLRESHKQVEPVIQYLDFKRFTDAQRETWLVQDVAAKCRQRPPQLIITLDNAAFDFALKHRDRFGAQVPLVFGGVNRFTPEMIQGQTNITGVAEESDFSGTFELIRHLRPAARHVLVISCQTQSGRESRQAFETFVPLHADRYAFEFFDRWTNEELFARLARLPDDWVALILEVTQDRAGRNNYHDASFTQTLSSVPRVPVFLTSRPPGEHDWSVEPWDGLGGGMVVADLHGAKVGELAARILAGEKASAIPVVRHTPQRLEVDYRQMQRFGLSRDLLPAGTIVSNAPVTFYQVHRSSIIAAGLVLVVLCAIIVALSFNILWRHRAERALRLAEEQLRAAQKLEAVGLLAGGVAHDFNNLLQVIRGHAEFLRESLAGAPQAREDVEIIHEATGRAAQLTQQLLAFSSRQRLQAGPVDPNALVTDMAKMLRRVLGEHIDLKLALLAEPMTLRADKGQLGQVLLNLCVNARDAMPAGGRIELTLRRVQVTAGIRETTALAPGPYLELTVADTGCGMPPEVVGRLFEPFFSTKGVGKGTGLGLSVVYGIIRQHKGTIRVTSEPGRGTTFVILLPAGASVEIPAAALAPEPTSAASPAGHGLILLAEDDPSVRDFTMRVLKRHGFDVVVAQDGEEALAVLQRQAAQIRLAILDVVMPRRSGREVFDRIRASHPHIRVLFCSGYAADMLPAEIRPDGTVALIRKPYTVEELLHQVNRLLDV